MVFVKFCCHSLRGECGLKLSVDVRDHIVQGHSLRGECGLKCSGGCKDRRGKWSLSARRVWIEMIIQNAYQRENRSLSARRVWIEISAADSRPAADWSLSARRVWIEIESIDGDIWEAKCHSLRGECGLKFLADSLLPDM